MTDSVICGACHGNGVTNPWEAPDDQITCGDCLGSGELPAPEQALEEPRGQS